MNLLCDINKQDGTTVMVSLHQFEVATTRCERIIALKNGEVVYDGKASGIGTDDLAELYGVEEGVCGLGAERPEPLLKVG
jgi:phosphonate transport system ATP-binding protein